MARTLPDRIAPRRARVTTCDRQTYLSRQTATNAAWILNLATPWDPKEPHPCGRCGDWHLRRRKST